MGCDIHLYVERRENNKWLSCDTWRQADEEASPDVPYGQEFYRSRNYGLFSILANVRNGRGFAGCDTGDGYNPISLPRGLPGDVSPVVKAVSNQWGGDGHSHSWLTVSEIMAYDWTQVTVRRGFVSAPEYFNWTYGSWNQKDQGNAPQRYCGDIHGPRIEKVDEETLRTRIDKALVDAPENWKARHEIITEALPDTFCRVSWEEPYWRAGQMFLGQTLPQLWALGPPDDVRIVFFFDS